MAGLVGIGLSRLFSASGLEQEEVGRDERLANSMGLFLQKTNIIRDYLEDVLQGREFWPKAVSCIHMEGGGVVDEERLGMDNVTKCLYPTSPNHSQASVITVLVEVIG